MSDFDEKEIAELKGLAKERIEEAAEQMLRDDANAKIIDFKQICSQQVAGIRAKLVVDLKALGA